MKTGLRSHLRRRWVRRSAAAAAMLVVVAVFHWPILRSVAGFLITPPPTGPADYLVLLPGVATQSTGLDQVAREYSSGNVHGIVLFTLPATRGVSNGIWPDLATSVRAELARRGVPPSSIVVLPTPSRTGWEAADTLHDWLKDRPDTRLIVMVREFHGRCDRRVFDLVLGGRRLAGLQFETVRGGIDETNWWHSREGIQLVFQNYVALMFDWWNGPSKPCKKPWTLEDFEKSLPAPTES